MRDDKLYIDFNSIDRRWKVLDQHGYCVGDGRTIDAAIDSARIVTNRPIFCSEDSDEIFDNVMEDE